jgi:hypothetical protein
MSRYIGTGYQVSLIVCLCASRLISLAPVLTRYWLFVSRKG